MKKVFLSAGHGGKDPGAVGNGLQEKNINLNILLACKDILTRHGVNVMCSRTNDQNDPVGDEVREANASRADIAVSFHTNAGGGDGSETYYWPGSKDSKRLAELCEKHTKAIGQNSRGIKPGDRLYFVNSTNMTSVLCECGFIDNKTDKTIIDTKTKQQIFGMAYAKAILEYFNISYSEDAKQPTPKKETAKDLFAVKVTIDDLNIRTGPGINYPVTGKTTGKGKFTIVETKAGEGSEKGWGRLKSNAGWISLDYATKL